MVSRSWKFPYGSGDLSDEPSAESVKSEFRFCLQVGGGWVGAGGEKKELELRLAMSLSNTRAWSMRLIRVMAFELPLGCG